MIRFSDVSKTYRPLLPPREVRAVDGFSLEVAAGEVLGIAGPNGAGKSTLLSLTLGFLRPTRGQVTIGGLAPAVFVRRHGIAYLSELVNIPSWWTVQGALRRYATLTGLSGPVATERVEVVIDRLGIDEHRRKQVKQLSKGNLQRLGLAQTLLSDSPVVILDEPTHGLDPLWTQRFRDIVAELRRPDRAIVIASHNLDELERLADRVAILDRGRLTRVADGAAEEDDAAAHYRLVLAADDDGVLADFPGAVRAPGERQVIYDVRGSLAELNDGLARILGRGVRVRAFFPARSRLEAAFREAVGDA
jgi:ABC-type multidrug transport system ATPase subunit